MFKGYLALRCPLLAKEDTGAFARTFAEHDKGRLYLYTGAHKNVEVAARGGIDLSKVLELTYDAGTVLSFTVRYPEPRIVTTIYS